MVDLLPAAGVLGMALLSALTFIAYKHPDGYERLHWLIRAVLFLVLAAVIGWDYGAVKAVRAMADFIDPAKMPSAQAAADSLKAGVPWLIGCVMALGLYFEFLGLLPLILADKKPR